MRKGLVFILVIILIGIYFIMQYITAPVKIGVLYNSSQFVVDTNTLKVLDFAYRQVKEKNYDVQVYYAGINNQVKVIEKAISSLRDKGVKFIVGPDTSTQAQILIPYLEKYNMFALAPQVTSPSVIGISRNFYSIVPDDEVAALHLTKVLVLDNIKKLIIIGDLSNSTYCNSFKNLLKKYSSAEISYFPIKNEALDIPADRFKDVDGVLFLTTPVQTGLFAQKIKRINRDIKLYGGDSVVRPVLFEYGAGAIKGLKIISLFNKKGFFLRKELVNEFKKRNIFIDQVSVNYYDSFMMMVELTKKYGKSPEKVIHNIGGYTYTGVGGRIYINKKGVAQRVISIEQIGVDM